MHGPVNYRFNVITLNLLRLKEENYHKPGQSLANVNQVLNERYFDNVFTINDLVHNSMHPCQLVWKEDLES